MFFGYISKYFKQAYTENLYFYLSLNGLQMQHNEYILEKSLETDYALFFLEKISSHFPPNALRVISC